MRKSVYNQIFTCIYLIFNSSDSRYIHDNFRGNFECNSRQPCSNTLLTQRGAVSQSSEEQRKNFVMKIKRTAILPCFRVEIIATPGALPENKGLWSYRNSFIVNFAWPFLCVVNCSFTCLCLVKHISLTFGLSPVFRFSLTPFYSSYPQRARQHALGGYRVYRPPCAPPQVMLLSCTGSALFCFLCVCGFCHRCTVHRTCRRLPLTCSLCKPLTTKVICQLVHIVVTLRWLRPGNFILRGTQSDLLLGEER